MKKLNSDTDQASPSAADLAAAIRVLMHLSAHPHQADLLADIGAAIARSYKRIRKRRRIDAAQLREALEQKAKSSPGTKLLSCYICLEAYLPHAGAYPMLCEKCAAANAARRNRRTDLTGRVAIVTGGRIKVGYHVALKLLRDGARVHATTRFPADAAQRFAAEPDHAAWADRLLLHALDLRRISDVQRFVDRIAREGPVDILINNAAQTIRRTESYYAALISGERAASALPPAAQKLIAGSATALETISPPLLSLEQTGHTWKTPLEEVAPAEMAEVMLVNAMAPFILCSQIEPLMRRSPFADRYIVNVTSAEGQFSRGDKRAHPHTNMAKAALNMLTRTSADRCAESGIFMTSVDPGWITHMQSVDPAAGDDGDGQFTPPLDPIDGAARVYDPILRGIAGERLFGVLLRDFAEAEW